jgi:hypothetical protein
MRSRRRAFGVGLVLASSLHASGLLLSRSCASPEVVSAAPLVEPASLMDVALVEPEPERLPPGGAAPGGGSVMAGRAEVAKASASPSPPKPSVVEPKSEKVRPPAPPREAKQPELEHGAEEEPIEKDLFALDSLLTEQSASDTMAVRLKPKPAWAAEVRVNTAPTPPQGEGATNARHFGLGSGKGGGPGGRGSGFGSGKGDGSGLGEAFGGSGGAFRGVVCAIPPLTRSIKSLGACNALFELYTDQFNVSTRQFELGFPGLPGLTEWFAILYTGKFVVEQSGTYQFRLASDDGSILQIDGETVIDHDGQHGPVVKRGEAELKAGTHELRLRYFQGPRVWVALQLWVTPPGKPEQLFGPKF